MTLLISLGSSLVLTEFFELLLALLFGKRGRNLAVVALANLLTNPPLVLFWQLSSKVLWLLLLMEVLAALIESFCYQKCTDFKHPYRFSFICNIISFMIGVLL